MPPVSPTSDARREAIRDFYRVVGADGRPAWSGASLAIHFGLDAEGPQSLERSLIETNRELARRTRVGAGTRVLDAGCGVGGSALWLAQTLGAEVLGITLVPEQVEQARAQAEALGVEGVRFELGDYLHTRLPPASVDVVWNLESLCHCDDLGAYLEHATPLLNRGGRLGCIDVFAADEGAPSVAQLRASAAFGALPSAEAFAAELRGQGYEGVQVVDLRARVLGSVAPLLESAERALAQQQLGALLFGGDPEAAGAHAQASVACARALLSGALTYAYVGGRRPR